MRAITFITAALAAVCVSCEPGASSSTAAPERLTVAVWNVQTLFDGIEDGTEYPDYSSRSGWTEAKYRERLARVGEAVSLIAEGGPDVLALLETENASVVRDLLAGPLKSFGYRWYSRAGNPGSALGLSVFSRYPIVRTAVHGVSANGQEAPRPMLETRIEAGSAPLVLLVCHWKSKVGGAAETEGMRRASAAVASRRLLQLGSAEAGTDALIVGDLNENRDEFERVGGAYATALLPDTEEARRVAGDSAPEGPYLPFLVVAGGRPPVAGVVENAAAVYSPWGHSSWSGSYVYGEEWETIDHILANAALFDGRGWEYESFRVVDSPPLVDGDGFPAAYVRRGGTGYSDHLPVAATLVRAP